MPDCTNFQKTLGKSSHECLEQSCKASEKANNIHEVCESLAEDEDVRASLPATAPGSQRRPDRCFQEQGLGVRGRFRVLGLNIHNMAAANNKSDKRWARRRSPSEAT